MASQTKTKNKAQDIVFIIDESGSMKSMGSEPVEAVNSFIEDQKKTITSDESTFTLWKFNTNVIKHLDDVLLKDVGYFSDFIPCGMTALFDAIGHAITIKLSKENPNNVVCIILTDGLENSSTDFTSSAIKKLISTAETEYNWNFVYLGANQDAFTEGSNIGISTLRCADFKCNIPGDLLVLSRGTSEMVSNYRQLSSQGENVDLTLKAPSSDLSGHSNGSSGVNDVPLLERSIANMY